MTAEMGEYLVGAYLKLIEGCDFVDYNVRPPGGGLQGLNELDVLGLKFESGTAYLCEVTTHVAGLQYGSGNKETIERLRKKYERQRTYAATHLAQFTSQKFQFWSPYVPQGFLTDALRKIAGLEPIINGEYQRRVGLLRDKARTEKQDTGNPVFRVFQILGALERFTL